MSKQGVDTESINSIEESEEETNEDESFLKTISEQIQKLEKRKQILKKKIDHAYGKNELTFQEKPKLLQNYEYLENELYLLNQRKNLINQYNKYILPYTDTKIYKTESYLRINNESNKTFHENTQQFLKENCNKNWSYLGYLENIHNLLKSYNPEEYELGFCSSYYQKKPLSIHPLTIEYSKKDKLIKLITKQKILIGSLNSIEATNCFANQLDSTFSYFSHVLFVNYNNLDYTNDKNSSEQKKKWTNYYYNNDQQKFIWSGSKNNNLVKLYIRKL